MKLVNLCAKFIADKVDSKLLTILDILKFLNLSGNLFFNWSNELITGVWSCRDVDGEGIWWNGAVCLSYVVKVFDVFNVVVEGLIFFTKSCPELVKALSFQLAGICNQILDIRQDCTNNVRRFTA